MNKKVVLITGASNGIGLEMAKTFAENDYVVIVNYFKSKQNAENLAKELTEKGHTALLFQADVENFVQVENMVKEIIKIFGHIDVLINNAGVCSSKILLDETTDSIIKTINTNLIGTINCCKAVYGYMTSKNYGKIINVSSVWGLYGASEETVYSASKGGINAFTKALSKELIYSGINVNAIAPGVVNTNMMKNYTHEELEQIKNDIPLKRFASAKEIAELALFLASDKASYITGQIIQIDGGYCS